MNNYDPDWLYFGFFPLKFPSKKGLKLASSRHPPPYKWPPRDQPQQQPTKIIVVSV